MAGFNWSKLWIEVDSIYVFWAFRKGSVYIPWSVRNRWLREISLAKNFIVVVTHIYREGNSVVDKLASLASSQRIEDWWFLAPPFIKNLIARDMSDILYYRFGK